MTLTLDANIWIAAYDPKDHFHAPSVSFLRAVTARQLPLYGPAFVLLETSCALARRAHDTAVGRTALARLSVHPLLILQPLNEVLLTYAARLGNQLLLRGADALYAATADLTNAQLVSWDRELVERANAVTPSEWLQVNL